MAFEKLKASPCFKDVHDRLEAGIAAEKVADWAQEERKCYDGIKRDSLVRALYRYKKSEVPVTAAQIVASADPQTGKPSLNVWARIQGMQRGLNELEEIEKLYVLQLQRINRAVTVEETINFNNRETRRDMELAVVMMEKLADLKMRLGIYKEADQTLNINAKMTSTHHQVIESLDPDARKQLGGVARTLLEHLTKALPAPQPQLVASTGGPVVEADFEVVESDPQAAPEVS